MEMNESFTLTQAIQELVPEGTNWTVRGPDIDTDIYIEDENLRPSNTAILAKINEIQLDYDAKQYQRDRVTEYPSIQECVHAILDDDLEVLQAKRSAVLRMTSLRTTSARIGDPCSLELCI